ncbi:MAG: hypothetical protein M1834_007929 [Cirrosporium novae-zelandiae]|nr:MAG: hypothetical protein M1834_007929 [Cirrosporium novae-zelandiae]
MEEFLPSYETATNQDPWELIAHYIPSGNLCAAALVCKRWCHIFQPLLWGNPTSHFDCPSDSIYDILVRYQKVLKIARLGTRELTHTLHLPPRPDSYEAPSPTWLRDILECLPNLRSLLASQLSILDHNSLIALGSPSPRQVAIPALGYPTYGLRLLILTQSNNTTSAGLAEAFKHLPRLTYIDLSYTPAGRDKKVLAALLCCSELQILKLRGIGLKDGDVDVLGEAIGIRARYLDVRDNRLTDLSVVHLLNHCFPPQEFGQHHRGGSSIPSQDWLTRPPSEPLIDGFSDLSSENLDQRFLKQLTDPLTGLLAFENLRHDGITHLYISHNPLTVEGIANLLKPGLLRVLDVGIAANTNLIFQGLGIYQNKPPSPRSAKLIPALAMYAFRNLTYLRIDHAITTVFASSQEKASVEKSQSWEIPREIPPDYVISSPIPPYSEYAQGETGQITNNTASNIALERLGTSPVPHSAPDTSDISSISTRTSQGTMNTPLRTLSSATTEYINSRIEILLNKRPWTSRPPNPLHPSFVPHLRTLVLTSVPASVSSKDVPASLIRYIRACADETELSHLQSKLIYPSALGTTQRLASQKYAHSLFGLQTIILEIASPSKPTDSISKAKSFLPSRPWNISPTSPLAKVTGGNNWKSGSATEDQDTESLWASASQDFSFFNNDDNNNNDGRQTEGVAEQTPPSKSPHAIKSPSPPPPPIDVVASISKFRTQAKAQYRASLDHLLRNQKPGSGNERNLTDGDAKIKMKVGDFGYWEGEVVVVRNWAGAGNGTRAGNEGGGGGGRKGSQWSLGFSDRGMYR